MSPLRNLIIRVKPGVCEHSVLADLAQSADPFAEPDVIVKPTVALKAIAGNHTEVAEKFRTDGARVESTFVIEAGCKSVIGKRLKQSGMFWTVDGANAIIALRCCMLNDRFEDYCEERRVA